MGTSKLSGIEARIRRADQQADMLVRRITRFEQSKPYRISFEDHPHTSKRTYRFEVTRNPPRNLGLMLSECVHHYRAALDNLAYLVVERHGTVTDSTAFPIYTRQARYRSAVKTLIGNVGRRGIKAEFERLQPYKRRYWAERHPLWVLHRMDIMDKHQQLLPVGLFRGIDARVLPADEDVLFNFDYPSGPLNKGALLGEVTIEIIDPLVAFPDDPTAAAQVQVEVEPSYAIRVVDIPDLKDPDRGVWYRNSYPVVRALRGISVEVTRAFHALSRFCD